MTWKHISASSEDVREVINKLLNHINYVPSELRPYCKVAAADQKFEKARGALFYYDGKIDEFSPIENTYMLYDAYSFNDYEGLFNCVDIKLNSLSLAQSLQAQVIFTNSRSDDASVVIYYPKI